MLVAILEHSYESIACIGLINKYQCIFLSDLTPMLENKISYPLVTVCNEGACTH